MASGHNSFSVTEKPAQTSTNGLHIWDLKGRNTTRNVWRKIPNIVLSCHSTSANKMTKIKDKIKKKASEKPYIHKF